MLFTEDGALPHESKQIPDPGVVEAEDGDPVVAGGCTLGY